MLTKYILGGLACVFLVLALIRGAAGGRRPQARAWLLVAAIFAAVSAYLFYQQGL